MKFGKHLEKELEDVDIPTEWKGAAIQYKALKKCIKSVVLELASLGLSASTLKEIFDSQDESAKIQYSITEGATKSFSPRLVLLVDAETTTPLMAGLAPETKAALSEFMTLHPSMYQSEAYIEELDSGGSGRYRSIEIGLHADSEFFRMLVSELSGLEALQKTQEKILTEKIIGLGHAITQVVAPPRYNHRSDLYLWREIFRLYVEAGVFFTFREQCTGPVDPEEAQSRLNQLALDVQQTLKMQPFKDKKSAVILQEFLDINVDLVRYVRFQSINRLATTKILKKFEKRTALS